MIEDYFSAEDSMYAAYNAELELRQYFESDEYRELLNRELMIASELQKDICYDY
jgi:hypothetical protein